MTKPLTPYDLIATPTSVSGKGDPGALVYISYSFSPSQGSTKITTEGGSIGVSGEFYFGRAFQGSYSYGKPLPIGAVVTVKSVKIIQKDGKEYGVDSDIASVTVTGVSADPVPSPPKLPPPEPIPEPSLEPYLVEVSRDLSSVTGKSLPGATVTVTYAAGSITDDVVAGVDGSWSIDLTNFVNAGFNYGDSLSLSAALGGDTSASVTAVAEMPPTPQEFTYTEEQERLLTRAITIVALRDSGKLEAVIQEMLNPTPLPAANTTP